MCNSFFILYEFFKKVGDDKFIKRISLIIIKKFNRKSSQKRGKF